MLRLRVTGYVVVLGLMIAAAPAAAQDYDVPTRPKAVKLKAKKIRKDWYRVRARVVLKAGQHKIDCEGADAVFTARPPHSSRLSFAVRTTFDRRCHSDIKVVAHAGTRLRVRFGGTDLLLPKRSKQIRLRK